MARTKKTPVAEQTIDEKAKLKKEVNRLKDLLAAALNIIKKQDDELDSKLLQIDELEKEKRIAMLEVAEKTTHIDFLVGKWMKESMRKKHGK
jgi:hypothetical protein